MSGREVSGSLQRIRAVSWALDELWRLPGTKWRFGLDPILGLIPVVGDAVSMIVSGYLILEAAHAGAPKRVLLRAIWNVAFEKLVSVVPIAGNVVDFLWKANSKNLRLVENFLLSPGRAKRATTLWWTVGLGTVILIIVGVKVVVIWGLVTLVAAVGS